MEKIFKFKILWVLGFAMVFFAFQQCSGTSEQAVSEDLVNVKQEVLKTNADFRFRIQNLISLTQKKADAQTLQHSFDDLRKTYKKMEWAVEYFLPHSARFINGPALPEIEFAESIVLEPEGLQVLEELIYEYDQANTPEIIRNLKLLLSKSGTIDSQFSNITVNRAQVFDALRNEIFRISSLSVAGFDTPVSGKHLTEIPYAFEGVKTALRFLPKSESKKLKEIDAEIEKANAILKNNHDKNTFDFAAFISKNLNKISALMLDFRKEQNINKVEVTTALKSDAPSFYAKNAFDVNAFVPGENFKISSGKIALGKKLFNDPVLSKDNSRSCASCHIAEKAFTDGKEKSLSLEHNPLARNTPSLNYSAFQHGQFWDMRNSDLEGQSSEVITNRDEMHGDLDEIIVKINNNEAYRNVFKKIYKTEKIEKWQLQNVLASYVRSLATFSSNFDEFMRGNPNALTQNQKEGFNLFVGKANCASCHFIPLFNGTVPPTFTKTEQEVLGTAENAQNKKLSPDLGRGKFHETVASLQHSFKTPTLRNISKTAPYMHNGGYRTLQDVMNFYNKGGGKGLGLKVDNQTLSDAPLNLTKTEIEKIIDFMKSLDDR